MKILKYWKWIVGGVFGLSVAFFVTWDVLECAKKVESSRQLGSVELRIEYPLPVHSQLATPEQVWSLLENRNVSPMPYEAMVSLFKHEYITVCPFPGRHVEYYVFKGDYYFRSSVALSRDQGRDSGQFFLDRYVDLVPVGMAVESIDVTSTPGVQTVRCIYSLSAATKAYLKAVGKGAAFGLIYPTLLGVQLVIFTYFLIYTWAFLGRELRKKPAPAKP